MNLFYFTEVFAQRLPHRLGQHRQAIFRALAVADGNFITGKVNILHALSQAFHQPKTRTIHQTRHQPLVVLELIENRFDLLARHHYG